ncbi:hydrolase [Methylothermus subterraneus]
MAFAPWLCAAEQSVLVIADVQPRLAEAMPPEACRTLFKTCSVLLEAAKALAIPVLLTEQQPARLGGTVAEILAHAPPEVKPLAKTGFACSDAEGFDALLEQSGRTQVVLTGIEAHVSVLQTALTLLSRGLSVFVVEDAVLSRSPEHKVYALERMRQAGAVVVVGESVVFEWLRDARHPRFKELVGLL